MPGLQSSVLAGAEEFLAEVFASEHADLSQESWELTSREKNLQRALRRARKPFFQCRPQGLLVRAVHMMYTQLHSGGGVAENEICIKSLLAVRERLHGLLRQEVQRVGDPRRVIVGGASQGCCAALDAALTFEQDWLHFGLQQLSFVIPIAPVHALPMALGSANDKQNSAESGWPNKVKRGSSSNHKQDWRAAQHKQKPQADSWNGHPAWKASDEFDAWSKGGGTKSWSKTPNTHKQSYEADSVEQGLLISAVQALYREELLPQDVLLQWWLHTTDGALASLEEIQTAALAARGRLQVQRSTTGRKGFAVLLKNPPEWFHEFPEDLSDKIPVDAFDEAAQMACEGGWPQEGETAHERVRLAAWLVGNARKSSLRQLSLGRAMALVNLLLSSHSVLGKRQGRLVPYHMSEDFEKQENSRCNLPTSLREGEVCFRLWEDLISHLWILLAENGGEMMSARLKVEMRSRFQHELSETALGHVSLGSLLDDERLAEHFSVTKRPPAADVICLRSKSRPQFDLKEPVDVENARRNLLAVLRNSEDRTPDDKVAVDRSQSWEQDGLLLSSMSPWSIVSSAFLDRLDKEMPSWSSPKIATVPPREQPIYAEEEV
ncbi:unnamed protein product [Symbiodinium sp. CCMP2592]|nr:unnamed protein product [Symbiodinium sp. CCMP2592]